MATTNDLNNEYYTKWDIGDNSTLSNKDNWIWTTGDGNTYPGDFNTGYPGYPYGKTNVPWPPQEENPYTNPYDKWKKSDDWEDKFPISPSDPFVLPTEPKVDNTLQNLINRLQTELAEQTEELNKIARKCDRLSKNNKKLKKENEELEKRNKKLNKFSRFDIIEIEEDEN